MNPRRQAKSDDEEDGDDEDRLLSEKQLEKRERESYKHSFLTKFLDKEDEQKQSQTVSHTPKARKLPLTKALYDSKNLDQLTSFNTAANVGAGASLVGG